MPGSAEPAGWRTAPNALYSGSRLSMQLKTASYSATSTTWPRPVFCRACNASSTPITPCSAARVSPMLTPQRTGTRPGSPVRWRKPPIASATTAKPGRSLYGPLCP